MTTITLSVTPTRNGHQAKISFPDGVSMGSEETFPTVSEAMTATALKLLSMPGRLKALDRAPRRRPTHSLDTSVSRD
jgi:hypothetical protein